MGGETTRRRSPDDRPRRILDGARRSRRAGALLDLIEHEVQMVGVDLPHEFYVWWDVLGTSRSIRPTKEWLEDAIVEKLTRDLGLSIEVKARCVEANRGPNRGSAT